MKYSIIIPTYNHLEDCLKPCIDSVLKYTFDEDIEIIVVANGCTDGTKEYLKSLPDFIKIVWYDSPLGYTKATNQGIKVATGEYIVLLNNDCILLEQNKNDWINILEAPFKNDSLTGITGVTKINCQYSLRKFLIFFCVMIKKEVFNKIGLLNEIFSPGGGDDIDFCIRAEDAGFKLVQVPIETKEWSYSTAFPIYHKAEGTFSSVQNWHEIFNKNMQRIREMYNVQYKFGNNFERAVIAKNQDVPPRETARYKWARENVVGKKILEIGCSSGYGLKFLGDIPGLEYLGIDYDKTIVDFATSQFGPFFKHADVNTFQFDQYDTIIAFEILEHIPNGREIAQKLKQHCKCLLATCPYDETPGFWGHHHQLHHLKEQDFPDFNYSFMDDNGNVGDNPHNTMINLMMMKWINKETNIIIPSIVAYISSKDRYFSSLPAALLSLINQTLIPNRIVIYLDGDHLDLRESNTYKNLISLMECRKIKWEFIYGLQRGQVHNHNHISQTANENLIFRLDDDNIMEPNVLEGLVKTILTDSKIGAVAGLVIDPKTTGPLPANASNKIIDIYHAPNIQWFQHTNKDLINVEHLYSSFLYRKEAGKHGYCTELSKVGHREETIMTHQMYRNGWKLLVNPNLTTYHFREKSGGIRSFNNPEFFEHDEQIFKRKLEEWASTPIDIKLVILDCGLGDTWCFKSVLPEIRAAHPNKKFFVGVCYPQVFEDIKNIKIISIAEANRMVNNPDDYNIYRYCWSKNWDRHISEAFKEMYI